MDWMNIANEAIGRIKKYRYAALITLAGILLLTVPGHEASEPISEPEARADSSQETLEAALARILCQIDGVGKTDVLLTLAEGEQTLYQTDENFSSGSATADRRSDTVLISGESRTETGLIRQIISPIYRGAIIVCQGADQPSVRLAVVNAVASVTGLTSDRITVLKMK